MYDERQTCPICGHPISECRDPRSAGHWSVETETCQPGRVAQAEAENLREAGKRGVVLYTKRNGG